MSDSWLKLARAEKTLEHLRAECMRSGKKLAVSLLAAKSGIDRKYFYGHIKTPDDELRLRWKMLGDEVKKFNISLSEQHEVSIGEQLSVSDKLRNALIENHSLVETAEQLSFIKTRMEGQLTQAREKNEMLEVRIRSLEVRLHAEPVRSGPLIQFTNKPLILSPDRLTTGDDPLSRAKAWVEAVNELRVVLARPLEKNLYVTIGVPGSGKTTWASALQASNRLPVIFDACSITKSDRYEILDIASVYENVRRIAVLFQVSLDTAIERNSMRCGSNRVPEGTISSMHASVEYPELFDSVEIFDEIIMVQS
ncbi:hypothetical protein ACYZT4_26395 [Pseudomonas sp. GB2N2]